MTLPVGRLLFPALRWSPATGFSHESKTIERALAFGAGGFVLFGGTPAAVGGLTRELTARAGRPLLFAADLERGAGQQFDGLAEFPPPAALAALDDATAIAEAAGTTAAEAARLGVRWVLGPVADLDTEPRNPIVQTRAFSADPTRAAAAVTAWIAAATDAGGLTCAKHWPGHGRTTGDSHDGVPVVAATAAELEADRAPFRAAVAAGVHAVMSCHVAFPALDPTGTPATFSAPILAALRTAFGFAGPIVTDALMMEGARQASAEPAVRALRAGCDVLLYPEDPVAAHAALTRAVDDGSIPQARVAEALGRLEGLFRAAGRQPGRAPDGGAAAAASIADRVLAAGPSFASRRSVPGRGLRPPIALAVVDDDVGGRWPVGPTDQVERTLRARGMPLGPGGCRIVLAFAEPRASKGRVGFSVAHRARLEAEGAGADLIVLFGHPRLAADLPAGVPVLVAWHRQRLMQEAVARWLAARIA